MYLAADLGLQSDDWPAYEPAAATSDYAQATSLLALAEGESAEGEQANIATLAEFAQALTDAGVRFFGASWCSFCTRQKEMFGTAASLLPYIETTSEVASGADTTLNPTGRPIESLPTWEFQDLERQTGMLTLQQISQQSGIPLPPNIVAINTNLVDFEIELLTADAPGTVANFLNYVNDGDYSNAIMHRFVSGFVLQGGGFKTNSTTFTSADQFTAVPTDPAIQNEYKISNTAGTIAMAKLGGDPNSATSQFFINLGDNSSNLDNQNGGFTVFARLVDEGLISQLNQLFTATNAGGTFAELPVAASSQLMVFESFSGSGTVRGFAFADQNSNGQRDTGEPGSSGVVIYSDANNNGTRDDGELWVAAESDGSYAIVLPAGTHRLRAVVPSGSVQTLPASGAAYTVNVGIGTEVIGRDFGTSSTTALTGLDLLEATDSGTSNTDNITNFNNSSADKRLQFRVTGVQSGATVRILADGVLIGQATGSGEVTVTTDGVTTLADGTRSITAVQVINGTQSAPSTALILTIDSQVPAFTSTPPTQATVGTALSYTVQNPEGSAAGSTYSLDNAPAGATLTPQGVLNWTPTAAQVGLRTFDIVLQDLAGNERRQTLNINVAKEPIVRVRFEVTDANDSPVSTVNIGDTFKLRAYVQDVRSEATGVFSLYQDITYSANLAAVATTNAIVHGPLYGSAPSGDTSTPGFIDEIGSFAPSFTPLGPSEQLLYTVTFTALRSGTLTFTGDAPDNLPFHDIGVYGENAAVPLDEVDFGRTSVVIAASFTANNDNFNFDEDTVNNVLNVLANDVPPPGGTLTIAGVGTPSHGGTVSISGDNLTLIYTPVANFFGEETFTYTVTDGNDVVEATVIVQVHPVNDPPTGVNDSYTVNQDSLNNFLDVLANDLIAPDTNETLEVVSVGATNHGGTAVRGGSGTHILYTPASGFSGTETFTYTLRDSNGATAQATVTVTVEAANDLPQAVNDNFTVEEDSQNNVFDVLANDSTSDVGETLTVTAVSATSHGGTVTIGQDGSLRYTPAANFNGEETFTYTISDGRGGTATAQVRVTVTPVNDPPTANADQFSVQKNSTNVSLDVLANDSSEPDTGETLTITQVTTSARGVTPTISTDQTRILYTPPTDFLGTDTFTYTISDGNGGTATATVTVNIVEYVPSSLSGYVYYDTNNDGIRDSGEQPVVGVTITLTGTDFTGAAVSRQTTTGSDGAYTFTLLPPGTYKLVETQPTGSVNGLPILDGKDTIGSQGGVVSANDEFTITLAEGTNGINNNFAELLGRLLSGKVMANGIALDLSYAGAGLELYAADASGLPTGSVLMRTTTDATGAFEFAGLMPQNYVVQPESQPFLLAGSKSDPLSLSSDNSENNTLSKRGLKADFINFRFFMNSTPRDEFVYSAAGATAATSKWYAADGSWSSYTAIATEYSAQQQTVRVEVTEADGAKKAAQLPISDSRVALLGEEGTQYLVRLNGPASSFNFQPATTSTAAAASDSGAEGEAANSGLSQTLTTEVVGLDSSAFGSEPLGAEGEAAFDPNLNTQVVLPAANLQAVPLQADAVGQDDLSQAQRSAALDELLTQPETLAAASPALDLDPLDREDALLAVDPALDAWLEESLATDWS